ncbi:unnamed protein product [Arabidopsis arenosa]|uniref:Retrotransposon gag domain-containing protein n=1 Tax=Arabidopsis arenosa TaxID=38785 RepID=A0A8S2B1F6_ARAAE|nr:unnamed protein product [Arabidopsis arenosa]
MDSSEEEDERSEVNTSEIDWGEETSQHSVEEEDGSWGGETDSEVSYGGEEAWHENDYSVSDFGDEPRFGEPDSVPPDYSHEGELEKNHERGSWHEETESQFSIGDGDHEIEAAHGELNHEDQFVEPYTYEEETDSLISLEETEHNGEELGYQEEYAHEGEEINKVERWEDDEPGHGDMEQAARGHTSHGHKQGPEAYINWEREIEYWFRFHNIPKEERLAHAVNSLVGEAHSWWTSEELMSHYIKPILTWGDLKQRMYKEFVLRNNPKREATMDSSEEEDERSEVNTSEIDWGEETSQHSVEEEDGSWGGETDSEVSYGGEEAWHENDYSVSDFGDEPRFGEPDSVPPDYSHEGELEKNHERGSWHEETESQFSIGDGDHEIEAAHGELNHEDQFVEPYTYEEETDSLISLEETEHNGEELGYQEEYAHEGEEINKVERWEDDEPGHGDMEQAARGHTSHGHKQGPEAYINWEREIEYWFRFHNIPKEERLAHAVNSLVGEAHSWWTSEELMSHYIKPILTWGDLKQRMYKEFVLRFHNQGYIPKRLMCQKITREAKKPIQDALRILEILNLA